MIDENEEVEEFEEYQADVGKFIWDKETGMDERFVFDQNPGDYGPYYKDWNGWLHGDDWAYAIPADGEKEASWDACDAWEGIELEEMFEDYDMDDVYNDLRGQDPKDLLAEYKKGTK